MGQKISLSCYRLPKNIKNIIRRIEWHLDYISKPENLEFSQQTAKKLIMANKILASQLETICDIPPPKFEDYIRERPPRFEDIDDPIISNRNENQINESEFTEYMEACVSYFQECIL